MATIPYCSTHPMSDDAEYEVVACGSVDTQGSATLLMAGPGPKSPE